MQRAFVDTGETIRLEGFRHAYCFEKTARDELVIQFLYENGWALASQLMTFGFQSKQSLVQRLHLLKKGGLIQTKRVKEFPQLKNWVSDVAYRGTPKTAKGLLHTSLYFLNPAVVERGYQRKSLFSEEMIRHQLGLGVLRSYLVETFGPSVMLSEQKWISQFSGRQKSEVKLIPDLVMLQGEFQLAVEYERTLKSRSRYLARWSDYDRSEFTHVLYVVESQSIFDKLVSLSGFTDRIGFSYIHEPHLVFKPRVGFLSFEEFFKTRFL